MKIIVYGLHENSRQAITALQSSGHEVVHLTHKYFQGDRPQPCDVALIVECRNWFDIANAYLCRGTRVFTLSTVPPELPGYPVATFRTSTIGDPGRWAFIEHSIPNAYRNVESDALICSFYAPGPVKLEPRPRPILPKLPDVFHEHSFAEAPRVWVIGGGPSLRNFDWSLLQGEVVIGANRAFEKPNVGITITIDPLFERLSVNGDLGGKQRAAWRDYKGIKVYAACESDPPRSDDVVLACRVTNKCDDVIPPRVDNLGKASNSGYAGVKLAWALGAKEIYCLGFDMAGEEGRQSWFHDGYPEVYPESIYDEYRREMDAAAPHMEADGVRVAICGPTALTAFPTITLAGAAGLLSTKPLRPVVCGYYTRGTRYKQEAETMARSAVAFGLDVSLVDVENLGDWKANTDQKPTAISFALDGHMPGTPIAFVDADARFRSYPALFDTFAQGDSELGLSFFDWDAFPNDPRSGRELSSAVMLLKDTISVSALLETWIRSVARSGEVWEQRVLQEILANYTGPTLKTMELPMRYNQIYDSMSSLGYPVIEQMQASRRFKLEVAA